MYRASSRSPTLLSALLGVAFLSAQVAIAAQHDKAASADAQGEVIAVVTALFDGMRTRDEALLRSVFAEEARLGEGGIDGFIERVVGSERHLDEVTFDETVMIDGDLAMAWTPYNIFIDGEFHHCGVDLFVMRRREGRWLITQLDDTRRTEGCDAQRRN
ncbi:MAG: nuclear transport factor 2 family protein [Halieaceae bacterium]|jgi:hypothetical protein|nr:nuclear transport factor 2 family protein [Halieaceae bacterium]